MVRSKAEEVHGNQGDCNEQEDEAHGKEELDGYEEGFENDVVDMVKFFRKEVPAPGQLNVENMIGVW